MRARLLRLWPWALLALAAVLGLGLFVDEAVAQSTGGSFGGGSFGGGGGGGGGSYSGGGSSGADDGDGIFFFVLSVLFSRLPWPLKIGLIVVVGGGWVVYKVVKQRSAKGDDPRDHDGP